MGKTATAQHRAIISILAQRFPFGFSDNPREVVPLNASALADIVRTLRLVPGEIEPYQQARAYYQRSPAYLRSLAQAIAERLAGRHGAKGQFGKYFPN